MELLKIPEVAKILKLSENRVYVLTKQGAIPSVKVSGSVRVLKEDLEKYIKGGGNSDTK
ncbi:DNA-binding protein [Alkalihalobacillus alcalophilus ATCC 27647 = CGMCC 1.3604]|uniref:DNA-binding protein n=1 Tax=Alkalihalobacillus alcalophilus ATCC 27647 = CGMCC 1.3604 TaxID=1218173 RepID=A0A094YQ96_ALKAL|nr:helix-turn-helix domain-containing protein [Alkalihalobacillus alcalophilus]KGA95647.1 DNA-binding protein [Alkalihalobacillus alcalophilus ATCC 27647 = CGMCC 1.3604]MED1564000.1 helix-turn-helix domain-containing protein [Alkalihalobacillus alcalophilus]THG92209.1 DNA-binding protein [Alkalihalobacillus alcalophilus ATCC 27647 = CGMCC 1.3604]